MCWHRHSNVGTDPQRLVLKLISTNDSKHVRAHAGIKSVMVVERVRPAVEVVYGEAVVVGVGVGEARTRTVLKEAHSNSSLFALEGAILEGINDIYLFVADDMARGQFNNPWTPEICLDLDDRTWAILPQCWGALLSHSNVANLDGAVGTLVGAVLSIATHKKFKADQLGAC